MVSLIIIYIFSVSVPFLLPEPFEVAYIQTSYTVIESEGQVRVMVNLTRPDFDILEETVRVESFNDENSVYIPAGAVLASEYHCVHLCLLTFARFGFVSQWFLTLMTCPYNVYINSYGDCRSILIPK